MSRVPLRPVSAAGAGGGPPSRARSRGLRGLGWAAAALLLAGSGAAGAEAYPGGHTQHSKNPPSWTKRASVCPRVNFVTASHPSGQAGESGDGYNVYYLRIVSRKGVSCTRARRLARNAWIHGDAGKGFAWTRRRAWRTTSGGSAYVGDFQGWEGPEGATRSVEYLAVH